MVTFDGVRPTMPPVKRPKSSSPYDTVESIVVFTDLSDKVAYRTESGEEGIGFLHHDDRGIITLREHRVPFKLLEEITSSSL